MNHTIKSLEASEFRVERRPHCYMCGALGRKLYKRLTDRVHSVPGEWSLCRCPRSTCGLIWMDPMPAESEIARLYPPGYFTHEARPNSAATRAVTSDMKEFSWRERLREGWRSGATDPRPGSCAWERTGHVLGRFARCLPVIDPYSRRPEAWLPRPSSSAKLLDVGCGSGEFLSRMKQRGWDVAGVELDPAAVQLARTQQSLNIHHGTLESLTLESDYFDAMTMQHVVEHLYDPRRTLTAAWRGLRPGGRLVVVTPNARSLGTRVFGSDWFGWEPPRHLHVFTSPALHCLLTDTGFHVERKWSTGRNARWTWDASDEIRRTGRCRSVHRPQHTFVSRWGGRLARWIQNTYQQSETGEELVVIGVKPPAGMPQPSPPRNVST